MTIGHSTRTLEDFVGLLQRNGVEQVVDVRTIPKSRRYPHFAGESLAFTLPGLGIAYRHQPGLGGLRHTTNASPNTGWRNESFRGYADYMQTPAFSEALETLIQLGSTCQVVIMCAEAVPWRCHRSLIADALLVRGIAVEHIIGSGPRKPHSLTPFARVDGHQILYPAELVEK